MLLGAAPMPWLLEVPDPGEFLAQLRAKIRMRNPDQCVSAFAEGLPVEINGPVFGDDPVNVPAGGNNSRAGLQPSADS